MLANKREHGTTDTDGAESVATHRRLHHTKAVTSSLPWRRAAIAILPVAVLMSCKKHQTMSGPDQVAVCAAAADTKNADRWQRFGHAVPVFASGLLFVMRGGGRTDVDRALAHLSERQPGLGQPSDDRTIACSGGQLVTWIPGPWYVGKDDEAPLTTYTTAFTAEHLEIAESLDFSWGDGVDWWHRECADARACCRLLELDCAWSYPGDTNQISVCIRKGEAERFGGGSLSCL